MGMHIKFTYRRARFAAMKTIGERIRERRKAKGLKQAQLAEAIGLDQSSISDIENKDPDFSARVLMKLADALEVTPEYIMRGTKVSVIEELEIVAIYKSLDGPRRDMLLNMLRPLRAQELPAPPKRLRGNGTTDK